MSARSSSSVSPKPSAFSSTVTGCLRLRSMRTYTTSRLSTSNSSHAPRLGITLASTISFSGDVLSALTPKYTPGERTSCETTMRSVPLMMNVPRAVIIGKSPMKTVCSLISPVCAFMKRAVTKSGRGVRHVTLAAFVLGMLRRVEDVVGQLELQLTGEILDRRDVAQYLGDTFFEKPSKRVGLDFDEVRKFLDLAKLRKRETLTGRETSQRHSNRDLVTLRARGAAERV